jgi:hypothetical protein
MSRNQRIALLLGIIVIVITATLFVPPIAQDPDYHNLSDRRVIVGIPNFGDVVSNVAFLEVGVLGLMCLYQIREDPSRLVDKRKAYPFVVIFVGTILIFIGSGYYHWSPSNETLVWDRLPIALTIMGILTMVIVERISVKVGVVLLLPLLVLGLASVAYWHMTEQAGHGDLRPYALVQFLSVLLILVILWLFPARYSGTHYLMEMIGWYAVAKLFEFLDTAILEWTGGLISGHSLKHFASAWGIYALVRYLKNRQGIPAGSVDAVH